MNYMGAYLIEKENEKDNTNQKIIIEISTSGNLETRYYELILRVDKGDYRLEKISKIELPFEYFQLLSDSSNSVVNFSKISLEKLKGILNILSTSGVPTIELLNILASNSEDSDFRYDNFSFDLKRNEYRIDNSEIKTKGE